MNALAPSNSWSSWIRMFDIPDVSKHKNGFTIYKVVSFLYPEACPDAVTKLIVWKRFNDFKKLHKEIKQLHKKQKLQDEVPNLPKSVLFKRYDEETINQRKRGILNFLEYIGNHSVLFTSLVFVKFFETSHTPAELLNSNINAIRADLNLPEDSVLFNSSEDDKAISDTDSFTSSNLGSTSQATDLISDPNSKTTNLRKLNSMTSIDSQSSKASESLSVVNIDSGLTLLENYNSPEALSEVPEDVQYLFNASVHVNMAVELESDKHYEEAFSAYKTAVDILISGGKEDSDYDRKQMVRYKTEKYLIRAEKLYNMYLAPEVKDIQLQRSEEEMDRPSVIKGPLYNLYKYKVIKIISNNGMLVLHSEQQQLYYVKVIHKPVQFLINHLILPEKVPYMVKLVNHYNSDNAIFLVLEYCSGTRLRDILDNKTTIFNHDQFLRNLHDQSDNESEMSFGEVFNAYAASRLAEKHADSDDSFEKVEINDDSPINILDQPLDDLVAAPDLFTQNSLKGDDLGEIESELENASAVKEEQVVKWMSQLLVAIERLHSLGVVCRDLKLEDLLIDENDNLVMTYMCNVKELGHLYSRGINLDLAPEVYSFEEITDAADWWSFGAILYELLVGLPLSKVHVNGIITCTHLIIPKYVSIEGKSLLKQLLIFDPQERLCSKSKGIQHIKSHPFFRKVCWARVESFS